MPAFPPPRPIAAFSDQLVAHDLPALPTGAAGRGRGLRRAADRRAAVADEARRRRRRRRRRRAGRIVGAPPARPAARRPPAAGARRVRPPRALAGLRLRVGDVAGHRARRRRRRAVRRSCSRTPRVRHPLTPTCWSSGRAPAAPRRRRCSPRPASTCSSSRRDRWSARATSCRSRWSRWTASTAPVASPPRSGCPSIAYTEGCCAGGGTEINSGLYRRPPEDVLDRWRARAPGRRLRRRRAVRASATRSSGSSPSRPCPGAQTPASEALRRGAAALGWRHDEIPRWMEYPDGTDARSGRRRSMTETYLPRADSRRRPAADRPPGRPARARRRPGRPGRRSRRRTVGRARSTSPTSFVCGGAIQTPALLQRSGLRRHIGRSLAVHPTVKLAARFDDAGQRRPTTCRCTR